jgi:hypothetical protein
MLAPGAVNSSKLGLPSCAKAGTAKLVDNSATMGNTACALFFMVVSSSLAALSPELCRRFRRAAWG